ncbi:MAG: PilZ domain-containing protein [Candidatus Omnitrophica bacterium]|nr:PilZ domain-containing protein [Candidatus Omnitrophota bacterium]
MDDRRQISRWQLEKSASVKFDGAQATCECKIIDMNFKGIKAVFGLKLLKDTFIKFKLFLSEDLTLDVESWVVWHKEIEGTNIYGLYFTKLQDSEKEQLYKFMLRNYPNHLIKNWWSAAKQEGGAKMGIDTERMDDKRVFERFKLEFPVRFLNSETYEEGTARTVDLSAKGVGLISKEGLAVNTNLELWLDIPDKGEPLYARGKVVWSQLTPSNENRMGINLERADLMGLSRALRTKSS